jgi:cell division protein FtsZ
MKNGGVAILGSATASGENRAQVAIEEALNSPLLNDNDIRGAKWILININSSAGENEFTMDEVEIIQNHLLSQAGENTDVILGLGYDEALNNRIGITLIATGFEYKDPFVKKETKKVKKDDEKIVMVLGQNEEEKKMEEQPIVIREEEKKVDPLAPKLTETPEHQMSFPSMMLFEKEDLVRETEKEFVSDEPVIIHWELDMDPPKTSGSTKENSEEKAGKITVEKLSIAVKNEDLISKQQSSIPTEEKSPNPVRKKEIQDSTPSVSAASGGYLARPSNIYAESQAEANTSTSSAEEPIPATVGNSTGDNLEMQLIVRNEIPAADMPFAHQTHTPLNTTAEELPLADEAEEQQRRAAERLQKLRNLSFNINNADPNNEFETVPAYIRRNMELYGNTLSAVENFYSNYEVKKDENNNTHISTINTFLDGDKPD